LVLGGFLVLYGGIRKLKIPGSRLELWILTNSKFDEIVKSPNSSCRSRIKSGMTDPASRTYWNHWIPAFQTVSQLAELLILVFSSFRAWSGIQFFFKVLRYWMPDQVRHDRQKLNAFLNYDTVCFAGMTL
jgi:hypothetical protein